MIMLLLINYLIVDSLNELSSQLNETIALNSLNMFLIIKFKRIRIISRNQQPGYSLSSWTSKVEMDPGHRPIRSAGNVETLASGCPCDRCRKSGE